MVNRKPKDRNAPKRPSSGYFLFLADERKNVIKRMGGKPSPTDVARKAGEEWRSLPPKQKAKYQSKADKLKKEYAKKAAVYKKSKAYKAFQKKLADWKAENKQSKGKKKSVVKKAKSKRKVASKKKVAPKKKPASKRKAAPKKKKKAARKQRKAAPKKKKISQKPGGAKKLENNFFKKHPGVGLQPIAEENEGSSWCLIQ